MAKVPAIWQLDLLVCILKTSGLPGRIEFKRGDMSPNFWTGGDIIYFIPPTFVIKSNVVV